MATVEVEVKDLDALKIACRSLGLEFREGQKEYKWFGVSVGDYPLPEGFEAKDLGKCEHAIGIPGNGPNGWAYEIGVVKRRDGKSGFSLMWDFFHGGYGLQEIVGEDCKKLRQAYAVEVAKKQARKQGYRVQEKVTQDGKVRLVCTR